MTRSSALKTRTPATVDTKIMSDTYYVGEKGDEIADYSYNYKLGTTTR